MISYRIPVAMLLAVEIYLMHKAYIRTIELVADVVNTLVQLTLLVRNDDHRTMSQCVN